MTIDYYAVNPTYMASLAVFFITHLDPIVLSHSLPSLSNLRYFDPLTICPVPYFYTNLIHIFILNSSAFSPLQTTSPSLGALDGGLTCRISNLTNGNVPCPYVFNIHVEFKIISCRMSNLRNCPCHVIYIFCHVDRFYVACRF